MAGCVNCGALIDDDVEFCPTCGRNASVRVSSLSAPPPTAPATSAGNTSGMGAAAQLPFDLPRWNWGAFVFGWLWGVFNRVWISLLTLIPLVGFVFQFVLGAKGNEWAWRKKRWDSETHFLEVQRKWNIAAGIYFGFFFLLAVLGGVLAFLDAGAGPKRLTSDDGTIRMVIPNDWKQVYNLDKAAELQARHETEEIYVTVYLDDKRDIAAPTLRRFIDDSLKRFAGGPPNADVVAGPSMRSTRTGPHFDYEIEATVRGVNVVFLNSYFETPTHYVSVLGWTLPSEIEDVRAELQEIVTDVQAIPGSLVN